MTSKAMWRRLLRLAHPDHGGSSELFVWCQMLREHVVGDHLEDERESHQRRQPPPHRTAGERIDFTDAHEYDDFADLTARAVEMADSVPERYGALLRMLRSCYPVAESETVLYRQQNQGATWRQAAFVAHLAGFDASQRSHWYAICREIPMSQRHADHLIKELQARAA